MRISSLWSRRVIDVIVALRLGLTRYDSEYVMFILVLSIVVDSGG